jgi:hypothetical protein
MFPSEPGIASSECSRASVALSTNFREERVTVVQEVFFTGCPYAGTHRGNDIRYDHRVGLWAWFYPGGGKRKTARAAFLFDWRACFPAPTSRRRGRGAQRRGWEERSHPEPRAAALAREHGEDGEHRTFPRSEHSGTLIPVGEPGV